METVTKVKVTRSGNVHLLNGEGKAVIKLHDGDAFYTNDGGYLYVARKEAIEYCDNEIHFDAKLPICKDGLDCNEWIELQKSRYVMVITEGGMMFTSRYEQYPVTANVIIAKNKA